MNIFVHIFTKVLFKSPIFLLYMFNGMCFAKKFKDYLLCLSGKAFQ